MTDGADRSAGRVPAAQDAMKKTPEELVTWAVERTHDDLRQSIVQLEFARRSAAAQDRAADAAKEAAEYTKANARYMLLSVIVLALSAVITAAATIFSAWLINQPTPP
jgi:hypothetical protein